MREQQMERIRILLEADIIDSDVAGFCQKAVDVVLEIRPDADEERFGMMVTHLAMGMQRLLNEQEEKAVSIDIFETVRKESCFADAEKLAEMLIQMSGMFFSQTEADFLKIHLCNVLS